MRSLRVLGLLILMFASGCRQETIQVAGETELNIPIPSFARLTLNGDSLRTADFSGKISLVNFWATWCGPCIVETPELVALQAEWAGRPFQVIGVSMDETGFEAVGQFAEDFHINYPQILDTGELADQFGGVWGLPTTFVVDQHGMIQSSYLGMFPFEEMRPKLDEMLKGVE